MSNLATTYLDSLPVPAPSTPISSTLSPRTDLRTPSTPFDAPQLRHQPSSLVDPRNSIIPNRPSEIQHPTPTPGAKQRKSINHDPSVLVNLPIPIPNRMPLQPDIQTQALAMHQRTPNTPNTEADSLWNVPRRRWNMLPELNLVFWRQVWTELALFLAKLFEFVKVFLAQFAVRLAAGDRVVTMSFVVLYRLLSAWDSTFSIFRPFGGRRRVDSWLLIVD